MKEHLHFIRIRGLEAQNAQLTARLDALEADLRMESSLKYKHTKDINSLINYIYYII